MKILVRSIHILELSLWKCIWLFLFFVRFKRVFTTNNWHELLFNKQVWILLSGRSSTEHTGLYRFELFFILNNVYSFFVNISARRDTRLLYLFSCLVISQCLICNEVLDWSEPCATMCCMSTCLTLLLLFLHVVRVSITVKLSFII